MLHQENTKKNNEIEITSSSDLTLIATTDEQENILLQLQQMIKLIEKKFIMDKREEIKGCFNLNEPDKLKIIFPTGTISSLDGKEESKRPIDYLRRFVNTEVRRSNTEWDRLLPHLAPLIVIIERPEWQAIIAGLELIPTPSQQEMQARENARMYAKC